MTLRARLTLLTSAAVALAIVVASVVAWFLIRTTLMEEIDERLLGLVPDADRIPQMVVALESDRDLPPVAMRIRGEPIGIQHLAGDGSIRAEVPPGDISLDITEEERLLLEGTPTQPQLRTVTVDDANYRVVSASLGTDSFIRMVQPLESVEATMTRMAWLLATVAGVGGAMAGGLGWTITRAGLRPVNELAAAAEEVARTKDLAHRIEVEGTPGEEVDRLAASVNSMLAALEKARIQQKELVENAGHELRTPLATLRNDIGLLRRAEVHPDRLTATERTRLLADLEAEATALSDLVAEVVDLARGDAEPEPVLETDLRTLVDRAVAKTRRINPSVDVRVEGTTVDVEVRPAALERAIANLVRNAIQVSDDGQQVEVLLDGDSTGAMVQVLDRGPGLAESEMTRIFDRFYRGQGARERLGSGLGLAIVAQVADMHSGRVEAANRPDGGAAFTLSIPLEATPADSGENSR